MRQRLRPVTSKAGLALANTLGFDSDLGGICTRLARTRSYYQTIGKLRGRGNDFAAWHARMLTAENRMRGLVGAIPGGTVMFGQDAPGNWFAVIGRVKN